MTKKREVGHVDDGGMGVGVKNIDTSESEEIDQCGEGWFRGFIDG